MLLWLAESSRLVDPRLQSTTLILLLACVGLLGLLVVVVLLAMWRRTTRHLPSGRPRQPLSKPPVPDAWQVAGQRLPSPPPDTDPPPASDQSQDHDPTAPPTTDPTSR